MIGAEEILFFEDLFLEMKEEKKEIKK